MATQIQNHSFIKASVSRKLFIKPKTLICHFQAQYRSSRFVSFLISTDGPISIVDMVVSVLFSFYMYYNIIKEEIYQIARLLRVCLLKLFLLAISSLCLYPSPNIRVSNNQ